LVSSSPVRTVAAIADSCKSVERRSAVTTICSSLFESSGELDGASAAAADSAGPIPAEITPETRKYRTLRVRFGRAWQWNFIVRLPNYCSAA